MTRDEKKSLARFASKRRSGSDPYLGISVERIILNSEAPAVFVSHSRICPLLGGWRKQLLIAKRHHRVYPRCALSWDGASEQSYREKNQGETTNVSGSTGRTV